MVGVFSHLIFLPWKRRQVTSLGCINHNWAASSEFGTYRLCEQQRFRRACTSAQSHQNLRCSLIEAVSQEEPSDRKPDPWPLWIAGHAQLKFVMMECLKTQIHLTHHNCLWTNSTKLSLVYFYLYHCMIYSLLQEWVVGSGDGAW